MVADELSSLVVGATVSRARLSIMSQNPMGHGNHRTIILNTDGLTLLDVVDERVVCIEMLDPDEITEIVHRLLP